MRDNREGKRRDRWTAKCGRREGKRPSGLSFFFCFLSGLRLLLSLARFHRTAIFAPPSIAASLLHVSGTVKFSSPSFCVLEENLLIFFLGFFPPPFSARRIGFSPQWKLCASVETSLDDDDDDVFSGLSCYA